MDYYLGGVGGDGGDTNFLQMLKKYNSDNVS